MKNYLIKSAYCGEPEDGIACGPVGGESFYEVELSDENAVNHYFTLSE